MKKVFLSTVLAAVLLQTALPALADGTRYPAFPVAAKMTAGAKAGNVIYVGLGTAGKAWYKLDLSDKDAKWTALAEFPDQPRDAATTVTVGDAIYVFAGQGKADPADKHLQMFDTVYRYLIKEDRWEKLPTRTPVGLLASSAVVSKDEVIFFGGVNQQIFNGYFLDYFVHSGGQKEKQDAVAQHYFDRKPADYLFNRYVLAYNTVTNQWRFVGIDPNPGTVGAALAISGNTITITGGEIKPGLRSRESKTVVLKDGKLEWKAQQTLPSISASEAQEGPAGAFAGYAQGTLLVAGGANFPGAWKQFSAGENFAHKGLKKTWRDEIYSYSKGQWKLAGKLPVALGYGSAFQLDEGVLIVGGELQGGAASADVFLLRVKDKQVEIVR